MEELCDARLKEIVCVVTIYEDSEACVADDAEKAKGFSQRKARQSMEAYVRVFGIGYGLRINRGFKFCCEFWAWIIGFRDMIIHDEQEYSTLAVMASVPLFIAIVAKALLAVEGHFVQCILDEGWFRSRVGVVAWCWRREIGPMRGTAVTQLIFLEFGEGRCLQQGDWLKSQYFSVDFR